MPETQERAFSESEMSAILADRLASETASLTASVDQLTAQVSDLGTRLDLETSAREAAEQKAAAVQQEFDDFKADITRREEAAARKDERLAKAREAASHLPEEFFADDKRVERIVAMDDEAFDAYVNDLRETAKAAPQGSTKEPPRETAVRGDGADTSKKPGSAATAFFLRDHTQKEG